MTLHTGQWVKEQLLPKLILQQNKDLLDTLSIIETNEIRLQMFNIQLDYIHAYEQLGFVDSMYNMTASLTERQNSCFCIH